MFPGCISNNSHTKYMNDGVSAVTEFKRNLNLDNARRKVDGRIEARLIELAYDPVLKGHSR